MSNSTTPAATRWPPQVRFILGNEAAERFSYYGVKGILALYITGVLLKTKDYSTNVIHLFSFVNYFMPLLGAWVSDRYLGRYHTILWISLSYCAGHGVMAMSDVFVTVDGKLVCLWIGLGLIAFGSGGIKPCVSAFMGDQFKPEQRHLLPKAYAAFYFAINLGSTLAFFIVPWFRKNLGYGWAFGVPGIAMAIATFVFWLGTPRYTRVPPASQTKSAGFSRVLLEAWRNRRNRRAGQSFWDPALARLTLSEVDAAKSVGPILSIFALIPVFWALFDQTFSTWVHQGNQMVPFEVPFSASLARLFGFESKPYVIGAEEMLSANPILVMLFIPVLTWGLYPLVGRWARPLRRMAVGLFLTALSYVVVAWLQSRLAAGEQISILWQIVPYIILTLAEVLVSTTGLEFAFTQAASTMKSTIMGFWNLTVALGNLIVIFITTALGGGHGEGSVTPGRFMLYAGMTFVVAIMFSLIASRYRYRDETAAAGK
jgi:POT family proton-dependent oligopeptide transporter